MFFKDLIETLKIAPVWFLMSKYDIIARYRRTAFGPWWITLGTGIALLAMGLVWGTLFKMDLKDLFPYLTVGFVFWTFIATVLTESATIFVSYSTVFRTIKIPVMTFIFNSILKNMIMLFHNAVIILIVFIFSRIEITATFLLFLPALIILFLTSFFMSLILAILGARLRDLSYIITSLMTFVFLLTPVMWKVDMLSGKQKFIAYLNPITYFITIIRDPLLNKIPEPFYYYGSLGMLGVSAIIAIILYNKTSKNLIYWM